MNSFDSRIIFPEDRFIQCFSRSGLYRYGFGLPTLNRLGLADSPFTINVEEARNSERDGQQHNVQVRLECGKIVAEPAELKLQANDAVVWYADDPATPGFSVSGYSDADEFSNHALTHGAIYVHPFGVAGDYSWVNQNGGNLRGEVKVTMPLVKTARDMEAYQLQLASPVMVRITGNKVEPTRVESVVGQAVIFVVEKADGITITHKDLLIQSPAER